MLKHDRLNTYCFDKKTIVQDQETADAIRSFIEHNKDSIQRFYDADYTKAKADSMLRMLGFSLRYVHGSGFPRRFTVDKLLCYEKSYPTLNLLIDSISKE